MTLRVRFVWTREEDVLPVADSVTTRRTAAARRMSFTRMRLYACHWLVVSMVSFGRGAGGENHHVFGLFWYEGDGS